MLKKIQLISSTETMDRIPRKRCIHKVTAENLKKVALCAIGCKMGPIFKKLGDEAHLGKFNAYCKIPDGESGDDVSAMINILTGRGFEVTPDAADGSILGLHVRW